MDIETLLRDATHTHARETGPPLGRIHDLATVARWRARRRRTRQLLAGAVTAAAVVVAGAVAVPQLVAPTRAVPVELAPASYTMPEFPYTPGWKPDGVADPHVMLWSEIPDVSNREVVVEHAPSNGDPHTALIQMRIVDSSEADNDQSSGPAPETVVVRDAPGVLTNDGRWLSVTWKDPADRLVQVGASDREVGRHGLLRYVEELVEKPLPVTPPVTLATTPVGAELSDVQPDHMRFDLPSGTWVSLIVHDPATVDELRADLRSSPDYQLPPPVAVELTGRSAELVDTGQGTLALSISFGPDLMLTISPWSHGQESLLEFAEGATLTPYARPAPTS